MHIYFAGIGGAGIGPLALLAHQAGYTVSGSDKQNTSYLEYIQKHGVTDVHVGESTDEISKIHAREPIDWLVYSSALPMENPNHPELAFARDNNIHLSKRDEFINKIISDNDLQLIAIAGTHGKTTTTAMTVWLFKQLGLPVSYILPAKSSFADMSAFDPKSKFFVYECDEFDRNFLEFNPNLSLITGIDWDHPDIYPTREEYNAAFREFIDQSKQTYIWREDMIALGETPSTTLNMLSVDDITGVAALPGEVNRRNAALVSHALSSVLDGNKLDDFNEILSQFPGVSRRFEKITDGLFSDYAHTPPKIRGALQLAHEVAGDNVVVVYEGLHNTRQHFIKDELVHLFDDTKQLYIVPSYLAREDTSLKMLAPDDILNMLSNEAKSHGHAAKLDEQLETTIKNYIEAGNIVLCLTAGGGGSLDEWLRERF